MNDSSGEYKSVWRGQEIQASETPFYNGYIASHLRPHLGKHILEIGIGIGNVAAELIKGTESYVGVDAVDEHIQVARERFKSYPFKGFVMNLEQPESLDTFKKEDVDTIISINCFEHLENDEFVMSMFYDWVKPGTKFAFLVPAHQPLYGVLDIQAEHFRRYEKKSFKHKIQRSGFFVEGLQYINSIGAVAWFLMGKCARNAKPMGHQKLSLAWQIMYLLLPFAKYPLMAQFKLETIIQMPIGLSLIAWGTKR